jgi:hypothetical protein
MLFPGLLPSHWLTSSGYKTTTHWPTEVNSHI